MKSNMFTIHADLDGYLEDSIFGTLNEIIYETILDVSEPDYAGGRLYSLSRTPFQVLCDAYRQLNKIVIERHPEESFKYKYILPMKDAYDDSHYTQLVFSVVYVIASVLHTKQSQHILSAIHRCMSADSAYFDEFLQLAKRLDKDGFVIDLCNTSSSEPDWYQEYLKLNEKYSAMKQLCDELRNPPIKDENDQLCLNLDASQDGFAPFTDMLDIAENEHSSDIFHIFRIYLAKRNGDLLELVKTRQVAFEKRTATPYVSCLTLSDSANRMDIIRLFRSLADSGLIVFRDGSKFNYTTYFNIIGDLLDINMSKANTLFINSINDGISDEAQTRIFHQLAETIIKQNNKR